MSHPQFSQDYKTLDNMDINREGICAKVTTVGLSQALLPDSEPTKRVDVGAGYICKIDESGISYTKDGETWQHISGFPFYVAYNPGPIALCIW